LIKIFETHLRIKKKYDVAPKKSQKTESRSTM